MNLSRCLLELIQNSIDAYAKEIQMIIIQNEDLYTIEIIDNGVGFEGIQNKSHNQSRGLKVVDEIILPEKLNIHSTDKKTSVSFSIKNMDWDEVYDTIEIASLNENRIPIHVEIMLFDRKYSCIMDKKSIKCIKEHINIMKQWVKENSK